MGQKAKPSSVFPRPPPLDMFEPYSALEYTAWIEVETGERVVVSECRTRGELKRSKVMMEEEEGGDWFSGDENDKESDGC